MKQSCELFRDDGNAIWRSVVDAWGLLLMVTALAVAVEPLLKMPLFYDEVAYSSVIHIIREG